MNVCAGTLASVKTWCTHSCFFWWVVCVFDILIPLFNSQVQFAEITLPYVLAHHPAVSTLFLLTLSHVLVNGRLEHWGILSLAKPFGPLLGYRAPFYLDLHHLLLLAFWLQELNYSRRGQD